MTPVEPEPTRSGSGKTEPPRRRSIPPAVYGLVALGCAVGVLYAMGRAGKEGAVSCPAAQAAIARIDPLIHGEVAAFVLSKPPRPAPDLSFVGPDGSPISLAALRGKTLLVNLWATWCIPCRVEMPSLDQLQAKLGGADFEVVAVNVDTARLDRPRAFLKDSDINNLSFYADPSAKVLQELKQEGQLIGLPTTLLVDRNGCELGSVAGAAGWASPEADQLIRAAKS